jgi:hypothetical protein
MRTMNIAQSFNRKGDVISCGSIWIIWILGTIEILTEILLAGLRVRA